MTLLAAFLAISSVGVQGTVMTQVAQAETAEEMYGIAVHNEGVMRQDATA